MFSVYATQPQDLLLGLCICVFYSMKWILCVFINHLQV